MNLKRVRIKGLYGSLNKDVSFFPDLSLLVGINGSGKTSVLNVIDWLLRCDFPRLATTLFEELALEFTHDSKEHVLWAVQKKKNLKVHLKIGDTVFSPIDVRLVKNPATIRDSDEAESLLTNYTGLGPEKKERDMWEKVKAIPKPTVIALDRTIAAETGDRYFTEHAVRLPARRMQQRVSVSPLTQVLHLTSIRYSEYRSTLKKLDDSLKARMVLSALRGPEIRMDGKVSAQRVSKEDIDRLERKVTDYVSSSIKGTDVTVQTKRFFASAKALLAQSTKGKTEQEFIWRVFSSQFQQIEDLASAFNDFDTQSTEAYSNIERYLTVLNSFLLESKKQFQFNETTNQLGFRFLSNGELSPGDLQSIESLSSGERQLLILLTFLYFMEGAAQVFIVDEPELSLHPRWQSEFLDAFLALRPKGTQLLLATHSPEIVGHHKDACVVLLP